MKEPIFVDSNTLASNPGRITVNHWVWYRHHLATVCATLLALLGTTVLCVFVDIKFAVLFIIIAALSWTKSVGIKEHFKYGDSNGGIVFGTNPTLVAIYTNLTKGIGYCYPVVKIIKCPTLKTLNIGDRVATVALYEASIDDSLPHWIDFNPLPVNYVTDDQQQLDNAFLSYDDAHWSRLQRVLSQVPNPYQPGLYKVDLGDSDWVEEKTH